MKFSSFSRLVGNPRAFVFIKFLSGGAGKAAIQYANIFDELGFSVTLVAVRSDMEIVSKKNREVNHVEMEIFWRIPPLLELYRQLRKHDPAIVLSVGMANGALVAILGLLGGFGFTHLHRETNSPRALLSSQSFLRRAVGKIEAKLTYRAADKVICLTSAMQREMEELSGFDKDKLVLIPNAVRVSGAQVVDEEKVLQKPALIVCVARLAKQKDHSTLLRAFAFLRKTVDARLQIAGDGPERAELLALVSELGIQNDVEFLGHVYDPSQLYQTADLCVLSSVFEGFPNVLIEALAQGCPVVATDCPTGPAEVIHSDAVGYLARMGDPEDLAAKMECALARHFDAGELRARAENFSEGRLQQRVFELLSTVLGR